MLKNTTAPSHTAPTKYADILVEDLSSMNLDQSALTSWSSYDLQDQDRDQQPSTLAYAGRPILLSLIRVDKPNTGLHGELRDVLSKFTESLQQRLAQTEYAELTKIDDDDDDDDAWLDANGILWDTVQALLAETKNEYASPDDSDLEMIENDHASLLEAKTCPGSSFRLEMMSDRDAYPLSLKEYSARLEETRDAFLTLIMRDMEGYAEWVKSEASRVGM